MSEGNAELIEMASDVLAKAGAAKISIATAESCTGGQVAALLTSIEGRSSQFDRGFVTYNAKAKSEMLGVDPMLVVRHGEVSREVAQAMAEGALAQSDAGVACAITGFTGPGAPDDETGLVHIAVLGKQGLPILRECHFGERDRTGSRDVTVRAALEMLGEALDQSITR